MHIGTMTNITTSIEPVREILRDDDHLLVSIIVPMRNAEKFITETLNSILREKETPIEVIVVNDKSTDQSLDRVLEFRDNRIRVIDGPGRGISACLNAGLAEVRGSIVMRCDADDSYPEPRIRRQAQWLRSHPEYDAVCGTYSTITSRGNLITELQCGANPTDITAELIDGIIRTHLCTYAIRSSSIAKIGGFHEYFETAEDLDFQLRLSEAGRIGYVPENWYFYRLHATSATHTQRAVEREFFERISYDLQKQRRAFGQDDLQKGCPPAKPASISSAVGDVNGEIQGMLLGKAWREHRTGKKARALKTGLRALAVNPLNFSAWKSVFALILK